MKISRIFKKTKFYLIKSLLKPVSLFNHALYMDLYIPLLKCNGMKLNGRPKYIGYDTTFDDFNRITLGDCVVISNQSRFLTHDFSPTCALNAVSESYVKTEVCKNKNIYIGNNVFIGTRSVILPGSIIEDNVIVGAGSVVRGKLEKNSIYLGNPIVRVSSIEKLADKYNNI